MDDKQKINCTEMLKTVKYNNCHSNECVLKINYCRTMFKTWVKLVLKDQSMCGSFELDDKNNQ